jgi:hypothetical protein
MFEKTGADRYRPHRILDRAGDAAQGLAKPSSLYLMKGTLCRIDACESKRRWVSVRLVVTLRLCQRHAGSNLAEARSRSRAGRSASSTPDQQYSGRYATQRGLRR